MINHGITFLSFAAFCNLFKEGGIALFYDSIIICDEFDSIVFGSEELATAAFTILSKINRLIGFTGSDLKDIHAKAIQKATSGSLIRMNVDNIFKPPPICLGADVYHKVTDFREAVAQLATQ